MRLILFGAGKRLQNCLENSVARGYEILAIADNDTQKQGGSVAYAGKPIPVISPSEIAGYEYDVVALTTLKSNFLTEIATQLEALGVPYGKMALLHPSGELVRFPKILPPQPADTGKAPIYYDVTVISDYDSGTGIQREVNNLYRNLVALYPNIMPSRMFLGNCITSKKYQAAMKGVAYDYQEEAITFVKKGRALLADMTWAMDYRLLFGLFEEAKIESYVVMYDIIPILHMHQYPSMYRVFQPYVDFILQTADALACISRTVADDIANYYKEIHASRNKALPLYVFREGFDIGNSAGKVRAELRDFVKKGKTFLSVGMNSPRKNHILTARAFYEIMQNERDFDGNLLFIGRHVKEEQEQFEAIVGKPVERIRWIEDAEDNELCYAYENARALVFATTSEGFGLPLVEAAYFGLPILASDIPIFREIAGENAVYFQPDDADSLRDTIMRYWLGEIIAPDSKNIRLCTWEESAREILDIMDGKAEPYRVLQ